jgi:hypothetical protein
MVNVQKGRQRKTRLVFNTSSYISDTADVLAVLLEDYVERNGYKGIGHLIGVGKTKKPFKKVLL